MPGMPSTPSAVETGASRRIELAQVPAVGHGVVLPPAVRQHDVAC